MKKTLIALIAGLFALALVAANGGAGTNDYSSGFGYWQDPGDGASIGYEAIGTGVENFATGQFDYREASRDGQGQGQHGVIFCLDVDGNEARFQIRMENNGETEIWEAQAFDNGDGNGGPHGSDTFGLDMNASADPSDCDHDDDDEDQQRINGDIVVEDEGFAGGDS